jgi:large subunit ribosomal protein L9e
VSEGTIFNAAPGTLFTERNIANRFVSNDINSVSVLSYAVTELGVDHVIVMGHYGCGGVGASILPRPTDNSSYAGEAVQNWIEPIRNLFQTSPRPEIVTLREFNAANNVTEEPEFEDPGYRALVEENVKDSVCNIANDPVMQDHWDAFNIDSKMRDVLKTEELEIPSGVEVTVKSRLITVSGPRGTLTKNVRHVDMDIRVIKGKTTKVTLAVWQAGRKHVACLRTIRSMINNMVIGVTKGFRYKMRAVFAHFPINCIIQESGHALEIRNFLGEKTVRHVKMLNGVEIIESKAQKDELILEGNDIDNVSQSAASIQGMCRVRNKDIRKFLDGIYVSDRGTIAGDD